MISPTGSNEIRSDGMGGGHYGAPRHNRPHAGADYVCQPGQEVVSPITGMVERHADPYGDGEYGGIEIVGSQCAVKMFYFRPSVLPGVFVKQGEAIGRAQDISKRHGGGMKPHIHLEIRSIDPDIFISNLS